MKIRLGQLMFMAALLGLLSFVNTPPVNAGNFIVNTTKLAEEAIKPVLSIPIPNVTFSQVEIVEEGEVRTIDVPWLAEYLRGVYEYAVGIAGILAAVVMMIGGFQYLTAGGTPSRVSQAKKRITDALIGLVLVLSSYIILNTINPVLVNPGRFRIELIEGIPFITQAAATDSEDGDITLVSGISSDPNTFVTVRDEGLFITTPMNPAIQEHARRASQIFQQLRGDNTDWLMRGGSSRSLDQGVRMFVRRCLYAPRCHVAPTGSMGLRSTPYVVKVGGNLVPARADLQNYTHEQMENEGAEYQQVYNYLRPHATVATSAHGNGLAIDMTCKIPNKRHSVFQPYVPCHLVLEEAMKQAGFCRLKHEYWHFEHSSLVMTGRSCDAAFTPGEYQPDRGNGSNATLNYGECPNYWSNSRRRCVD